MIYTYATKESAIKALPNFCSKKEQDVFVYRVTYPSGTEWSLRLRDQVMDEDSPKIEHKYYHPIGSHFINRDNAYREAKVWTERLQRPVTIERHYRTSHGYAQLTHYTLIT